MTGTVYNREDLAWAAGLFDGEGYIGAFARKAPSKGRRMPYPGLSSAARWPRTPGRYGPAARSWQG